MSDVNPRAVIGGNEPPEPTPFETVSSKIEDLFEEAALWLDGEGVTSQEHADDLSRLMDYLRKGKTEADNARKAEAKPFDDGKAEVQARYNPILKKADTAVDACKRALAPWLQKLEEQQRAAAAEARRIAEEKVRCAAEAARQANSANLAERAAAEEQIAEAKRAESEAKRAEAARPQATGSARPTTLRSYWTAELTDLNEAVKHYWTDNKAAFEALVQQLADQDVRSGKRQIIGFRITEERRVV